MNFIVAVYYTWSRCTLKPGILNHLYVKVNRCVSDILESVDTQIHHWCEESLCQHAVHGHVYNYVVADVAHPLPRQPSLWPGSFCSRPVNNSLSSGEKEEDICTSCKYIIKSYTFFQ